MNSDKPQRMVTCPFTGKKVPFVARPVATKIDIVDPKPLPAEVKQTRKQELEGELDTLRKKWVDIGPTKRAGAAGDKVMKAFRKLALEYWHVTGNHPAGLDSEL
jgi:hypothetical protein